jgi:hypothetical protein
MQEISPTESHIELWPNVQQCVFVPVQLDTESSPDNSRIDCKNLDDSVKDTFDDNVWEHHTPSGYE